MSRENKYCPECGTSNPEDSRYCFECGNTFEEEIEHPIEEATVNVAPTSKKLDKKKKIGIALSALVLVVGGIFIIDLMKEDESEQTMPQEEVTEKEETVLQEDVESPEETQEAVEEVFTYWEMPREKIGDYGHTLTLGFSNTNKVEAEIKYASITQGHYRYFMTVTEDEAASSDFERYYRVDEVEKIEYDLSSGDYSYEKENINDHLDAGGFIYDVERVDTLVRYTIYEPDLEQLKIGSLPDYPHEYIIQQIDYAAEANDLYEDYLMFMEEYQLLPAE